ncbi:hypothetical protein SAMN05428965_1655 [Geodermatophilus sp. DSM 45219]|nr:hypothetical protein SAMN05428965_1655 [Geodermatophilus sp. DSM 45219]
MFWGRAFWIALVLFAGVTLYGIYRRRIEGLLIERAGLTVMAALYGTYIYASLAVNGLDGVTSIALPLSFVVANLARCWQIRTDLVLMSSYLKEHPGVDLR